MSTHTLVITLANPAGLNVTPAYPARTQPRRFG